MDKCMQMPGGGPFRLAGGQVTDDSELAMCIMHGLVSNKEEIQKGSLDINKIAVRYRDWILSPPFDIGMATSGALGPLTRNPRA